MDYETVFSVFASLGVGGIIGSYLQNLWHQRGETESKVRSLNEGQYRSTLIFMRCVLRPESIGEFDIPDPRVREVKERDRDEIIRYANTRLVEFYYNSLLYSSDRVLLEMKDFIKNPTETAFMKTAVAMRKELWGRETKVDLESLSLE